MEFLSADEAHFPLSQGVGSLSGNTLKAGTGEFGLPALGSVAQLHEGPYHF
ncbi:hypothetical protein [Deinococcus misasensis]|uniref:hypothetical protein n=1 Tax=Deinococcus misasensis TaxID=392413 RepID=UPI0012FCF825|nr:hypothetical protein [Deinococcus misasensis]